MPDRAGAAHAPHAVNRPPVYFRLSASDALDALRRMHRIRRFEEAAEESYMRGLSYGTMHLSIGQEATAVGVCMPLTDADYITSTHRGHGHCIAKGADLKPMFAEFLGKETGYLPGARRLDAYRRSRARAISAPTASSAAGCRSRSARRFSAKRRGDGAVAVAFFGDGANNEGAFHESLNIASVWKLPVVFVCENNQYAMSTAIARSTAVRDVADRASAYAMPGVIVDGNDFADVAEASFQAVERARAGDGPTLIEAKTYRTRGHSRSDRNRYRTREEIESWRQRDPIAAFEAEIVALGLRHARGDRRDRGRGPRGDGRRGRLRHGSPTPNPADVTRDVYSPRGD